MFSTCSFAVPSFSFTQVMVQGCTSLSYEHNESRVLPSHPSSFNDRAALLLLTTSATLFDGCDGCETKESSMTLWSTPSTTITTDAGSISSPDTGDRVTAPAMAAASTTSDVEATAVKVLTNAITLRNKVNKEEQSPPNYLHLPTCDLKEVVTPFPDLANSMNTMSSETPKDMPTTPSLAGYETCRLSAEIPSVDATYVSGIHFL